MTDLTPKENTALDVAMTRLGELVDRMERASHPYPRERTWPDCEAELERLRLSHLETEKEIERLRMELTKVGNGSFNPALVLAEQQAEIKRLRQETLVQSEAIETLRSLLNETLAAPNLLSAQGMGL